MGAVRLSVPGPGPGLMLPPPCPPPVPEPWPPVPDFSPFPFQPAGLKKHLFSSQQAIEYPPTRPVEYPKTGGTTRPAEDAKGVSGRTRFG